ncbi:MAG: glycosyltransferase family 4 protein [Chthoniobacterales bacterium]
MTGLAYLFERFPSFTQTFCYREIVALQREGVTPALFAIRRPRDEPPQEWDPAIARAVQYLPGDDELVREIDRALRKGQLPEAAARELKSWGRQRDFLRLYQAAWLGPRLQAAGVRHLHAHFAGLAARTAFWVERFFGIGFSFTAHANDFFAPKEFTISLGKLIAAARAVVTVSDFGVNYLRGKFPAEALKFRRVYNGIELERFQAATFTETPPLILSVGRLIEKKGFNDLIAAGALLAQEGVGFRTEIIGEGPLAGALQAQIERAGLANKVTLVGPLPQSEISARLAHSWVFALPCVTEAGGGMDNLPTVVMEAMAAGLPVVSTPLGGVPEMVVDGVTGLLVPEQAPAALGTALARLLGDRVHASSLGRAGRARAAELFASERSARELRALFAAIG